MKSGHNARVSRSYDYDYDYDYIFDYNFTLTLIILIISTAVCILACIFCCSGNFRRCKKRVVAWWREDSTKQAAVTMVPLVAASPSHTIEHVEAGCSNSSCPPYEQIVKS